MFILDATKVVKNSGFALNILHKVKKSSQAFGFRRLTQKICIVAIFFTGSNLKRLKNP